MGSGSSVSATLPVAGQVRIPDAYLNNNQKVTQNNNVQQYNANVANSGLSTTWLGQLAKILAGGDVSAAGSLNTSNAAIPQAYLKNNVQQDGGLLGKFDAGASLPSVYQNRQG